jgi:plasmid stability protein
VAERMMADCRRFESDSSCTLTIIGEADDVVDAAVQHAVASHGHTETPEMREQLRALLEPESAYVPGERTAEPFPA